MVPDKNAFLIVHLLAVHMYERSIIVWEKKTHSTVHVLKIIFRLTNYHDFLFNHDFSMISGLSHTILELQLITIIF